MLFYLPAHYASEGRMIWRPSLGDGAVLGKIRTEIPYADALILGGMTPVTSSRHRSLSQHPRDLNFTDLRGWPIYHATPLRTTGIPNAFLPLEQRQWCFQ
jgi:hypothetical protein